MVAPPYGIIARRSGRRYDRSPYNIVRPVGPHPTGTQPRSPLCATGQGRAYSGSPSAPRSSTTSVSDRRRATNKLMPLPPEEFSHGGFSAQTFPPRRRIGGLLSRADQHQLDFGCTWRSSDLDRLRNDVMSRPALIDVAGGLESATSCAGSMRPAKSRSSSEVESARISSPTDTIAMDRVELRSSAAPGQSDRSAGLTTSYGDGVLRQDLGFCRIDCRRLRPRRWSLSPPGRGFRWSIDDRNDAARAAEGNGTARCRRTQRKPIFLLLRLRTRMPLRWRCRRARRSSRPDVTALHALVFDRIFSLRAAEIRKGGIVEYTTDAIAALDAVIEGRADGAFLMNPPSIVDVERVSDAGATMPEKSTYFYPKLLTGLVLNPLDD